MHDALLVDKEGDAEPVAEQFVIAAGDLAEWIADSDSEHHSHQRSADYRDAQRFQHADLDRRQR